MVSNRCGSLFQPCVHSTLMPPLLILLVITSLPPLITEKKQSTRIGRPASSSTSSSVRTTVLGLAKDVDKLGVAPGSDPPGLSLCAGPTSVCHHKSARRRHCPLHARCSAFSSTVHRHGNAHPFRSRLGLLIVSLRSSVEQKWRLHTQSFSANTLAGNCPSCHKEDTQQDIARVHTQILRPAQSLVLLLRWTTLVACPHLHRSLRCRSHRCVARTACLTLVPPHPTPTTISPRLSLVVVPCVALLSLFRATVIGCIDGLGKCPSYPVHHRCVPSAPLRACTLPRFLAVLLLPQVPLNLIPSSLLCLILRCEIDKDALEGRDATPAPAFRSDDAKRSLALEVAQRSTPACLTVCPSRRGVEKPSFLHHLQDTSCFSLFLSSYQLTHKKSRSAGTSNGPSRPPRPRRWPRPYEPRLQALRFHIHIRTQSSQ
jgi:hypothetical protein